MLERALQRRMSRNIRNRTRVQYEVCLCDETLSKRVVVKKVFETNTIFFAHSHPIQDLIQGSRCCTSREPRFLGLHTTCFLSSSSVMEDLLTVDSQGPSYFPLPLSRHVIKTLYFTQLVPLIQTLKARPSKPRSGCETLNRTILIRVNCG